MSLRSHALLDERSDFRGEANPGIPKVLVALHACEGQVNISEGRSINLLVLGRRLEILDPAKEVVAEQ